jgi:acylphosphatase
MDSARLHLIAHGRVQGVGYRYFAHRAAQALGLVGWVRNREDGGVEAEVQGAADTVDRFVGLLRQGPRGSEVESLESRVVPPRDGEEGFAIRF